MAIGRARGFWVTRWRDDAMSEGLNALLGTEAFDASESISPVPQVVSMKAIKTAQRERDESSVGAKSAPPL